MVVPLLITFANASLITEIRTNLEVPAMGMLTIENGLASAPEVEGNTRVGFNDPIKPEMPWHLGSNTKAFAAALVAILIEDGRLSYSSKVLDILEIDPKTVSSDWKDLSIRALLEHTSGISAESYPGGFGWYDDKRPIRTQRLEYAKKALAAPPMKTDKVVYSNANYVILAALCEKVANKDWEKQIEERIFKPLGITTGGFGPCPPKAPQPHKVSEGKFALLDVGDVKDNAPVLMPASGIHMSLGDYGKWLQAVLTEGGIMSKNSWRLLLTPTSIRGGYAGGWILVRDHGISRYITHCGSNTMNTAACWIDFTNRRAIAMCANGTTDELFKAMNEACMKWAARQ